MMYDYRVVRITAGMSDREIDQKIKEIQESGFYFWELVAGADSFIIFRKKTGTTVISE